MLSAASLRVSIPESVVVEALEGEMVLLNLDTGIYYGLNATGSCLWASLKRHGDPQRAIAELYERYADVPLERISQDSETLIDLLLSKGLLARASASGSAHEFATPPRP
jgi:hypothetical protein